MISELVALTRSSWPVLLVLSIAIWLIRNKYRHGLNKYPGPVAAAYTDWWRFYDVYKRKPERTHIELHRKHGDIVRLGPNVLSFADPQAIKTIYGLNKGFTKVLSSCPPTSIRSLILTLETLVRVLPHPASHSQGEETAKSLQHKR